MSSAELSPNAIFASVNAQLKRELPSNCHDCDGFGQRECRKLALSVRDQEITREHASESLTRAKIAQLCLKGYAIPEGGHMGIDPECGFNKGAPTSPFEAEQLFSADPEE